MGGKRWFNLLSVGLMLALLASLAGSTGITPGPCAGRIPSSAAILARQDVESLLTGQTRGGESARASSRVSHH